MKNIDMQIPDTIRFGCGTRYELDGLLPPGPVMVICGRHSAPLLTDGRMFGDRQIAAFCDCPPELPLDVIGSARDIARKSGVASVVGIGGGSAMDAAKAVAALMESELPVEEFFYGRAKAIRSKTFFAALPTTAGTGAEVTANAVICDTKTGIKQSLRGDNLMADAALVDPELVAGAPLHVMASAGLDALTQAVESYCSRRATDFTRLLAMSAAATLLESLKPAVEGDIRHVAAITRASLETGIAFASSGLGAVHGIAHPLGSVRHVPHGICCAVLLTEVLRFNNARGDKRIRELAVRLGFSSVDTMVDAISMLRSELGVPGDFRAYGLSERDFSFIVANCRSGSMRCNPVDMSDGNVIELLGRLL
ncbi:MAG: iron-containing alcohol dehydrogenase [Victivallaceae bacterium]|nr:iron-containing alcohol dehydrogenase [Victivallaceae bacterium]